MSTVLGPMTRQELEEFTGRSRLQVAVEPHPVTLTESTDLEVNFDLDGTGLPMNPELTFTRRRVMCQRRELRNLNRAVRDRNAELELQHMDYTIFKLSAGNQFLRGALTAAAVGAFLLALVLTASR